MKANITLLFIFSLTVFSQTLEITIECCETEKQTIKKTKTKNTQYFKSQKDVKTLDIKFISTLIENITSRKYSLLSKFKICQGLFTKYIIL